MNGRFDIRKRRIHAAKPGCRGFCLTLQNTHCDMWSSMIKNTRIPGSGQRNLSLHYSSI
jgi:hypothetical protein